MKELNNKHRLFVEAYTGNNIEAMRIAGFTGTDGYLNQKAEELLADPLIMEAIKQRSKYRAKLLDTIAGREERQALWTAVMRNEDPHARKEVDPITNVPKPLENIPLATRLKASELLGKSEQDFVDKVELTGQMTITDVITKSYKLNQKDDASIEEIEAEYYRAQESRSLPVIEDNIVEAKEPTMEDLI